MKLRMLYSTAVCGTLVPIDAVIDAPDHIAKDLIEIGAADPHPEAVAYAQSLGVVAPAIDFTPPPEGAGRKK